MKFILNAYSLLFRPYLEAIFNALESSENDYEALFALCLLYAMGHNEGKLTFNLLDDLEYLTFDRVVSNVFICMQQLSGYISISHTIF